MEETPWTWKLERRDIDGKVDGVISSSDSKSQLKLVNVDPRLIDDFTGLLISSYKWGAQGAPETSSGDTADEIKELKAENKRLNQAIGGLKGQLTKLKSKYESGDDE